MRPKLLLFILLQLTLLEKTASLEPCKLTFDFILVQTPDDAGQAAEIKSSYSIQRLSPYQSIASENVPTFEVPIKLGSRNCDASTYQRYIRRDVKKSFANCRGDFRFSSKGLEDDNIGDDLLWEFTKDFKCDGQENKKRECRDGGGAEVKVTCTSYAWEDLSPAFNQTITNALDKGTYPNLYQSYSSLLRDIHSGGYMSEEINPCSTEDSWTKYDSCRVSFFKPILGVIALYAPQSQDAQERKELDEWSTPDYFFGNRKDWKNVDLDTAKLTKKALLKKQTNVEANLFKREMLYTMISRLNPDFFPLNENPISQYAKEWYEYARDVNDGKLREILDKVEVNDQVTEYCTKEAESKLGTSPFCSIIAAKKSYDRSKLYFPDRTAASVISISANVVGENAMFTTVRTNLDQFLDVLKITDAIDQLSEKFSTYFTTLANFDNEIAKADVAYISSAIDKNNERLSTNGKKFQGLVEDLKKDQATCNALNIVESIIMVGVSIAVCVASGGAVPVNFKSITDLGTAVSKTGQTFLKTTVVIEQVMNGLGSFKSTVETIHGQELSKAELDAVSKTVGSVTEMVQKLKDNAEKIEGMQKISEAVLKGTSMNMIQTEVKIFIASYNDYTPAITKVDLVSLNKQYEDMLDAFAATFENAGFLCKLAVGTGAAKAREAKRIWTAISALLEDIYDQQFTYIDSIVKVVRSTLDRAAAREIAPGINYNFEILVRQMLAVRVAAQRVCDTFQLLGGDVQPHATCKEIGTRIFLEKSSRDTIGELDGRLQTVLNSYKTNERYAFIPVSDDISDAHAVNWVDLISRNVVEFALPENNAKFLKDNGWIDLPTEAQFVSLLQSLELFIPDINLGAANNNNNDGIAVLFKIAAIQDRIVVNGKPTAQRYTLKSQQPLSTLSKYKLNDQTCPAQRSVKNLFVSDGSTKSDYCLELDTGRFSDDLKLSLPVSMYSKFRIQLVDDGYSEQDRNRLKQISPFGDTLKLRVRIHMFSNPGGSKGRSRQRIADAKLPASEYCGEGNYRAIIDGKAQCAPCPPGSVPFARGSFCISEEHAKKIAEKV